MKQGYHNTGLNQILVTAKVSKGSFYYHFEKKEAFALSVLEWFVDEKIIKLKSIPAERDDWLLIFLSNQLPFTRFGNQTKTLLGITLFMN